MFIGHLPAAYLAFKAAAPKTLPLAAFAVGLIGGVLPDIDMLWFTFVDSSRHHHEFITHRPVVWATLGLASVALYRASRHQMGLIGLCLSLGALLHLILDSIAGKVSWLWPVSDVSLTLVQVQATHDHWIKSFLYHWTFKIEIAVTVTALIVLMISWRRKRTA